MLALGLGTPVLAEPSVSESLSPDNLPADFYTFTPEEFWREPRDSYWLNFSNWVIHHEHVQSERIQILGAWADRTLSGNARSLPGNESYLRLGLAAESETGKLASVEPEARFRLDLPTAEEQLRVVLESESDELVPLGERRRSRQLTDDQRSDSDATGALRYLSVISDTINLSNDIGARLRFPPDAFWRATARGTGGCRTGAWAHVSGSIISTRTAGAHRPGSDSAGTLAMAGPSWPAPRQYGYTMSASSTWPRSWIFTNGSITARS